MAEKEGLEKDDSTRDEKAHQFDDDQIANLVQKPFTRWTIRTNLPFWFVAPKFHLFDETTNPTEHVIQYYNALFRLEY